MTEASLATVSRPLRVRRTRTVRLVAGALVILTLGAVVAGAVLWRSNLARHGDPFEEGRAAISRQQWAAARQFARELKVAPDRQADAAFLRGEILFHKGYYYPALDELAQARDKPELRPGALVLAGQCWYQLGRHVEAQEDLHEVLKHQPDSVEAHRWLAASYYDLGAIHDALVHLKRTAELDPADQRPHRLLGLIYKDYERFGDAVPAYEESLRRKPDQADAENVRLELAICQMRLRRHHDALQTLAACANSPEVDVVRAECHYAVGQTAQAKESLARASAGAPDNLDVLLLRGTMMLDDGNAPRAAEILTRAASLHPRDYMVHFKLAQALAQADKPKQAEAEQQLAEQIRGLRKEFADLHQAAWNNPRDGQIRLRLATLANELGRPDLAEVWLKSAAALVPLSATRAGVAKPVTGQPEGQ